MITPTFIFTIFMLTLGPIKTVPAFFAMTQGYAPNASRALAAKGAAMATAVALLIALVMVGVAASWRVSLESIACLIQTGHYHLAHRLLLARHR
jgi:multiple antibiotic resistance protein